MQRILSCVRPTQCSSPWAQGQLEQVWNLKIRVYWTIVLRKTAPQRNCEASHPIKGRMSYYRIWGKGEIKVKIKCSALISCSKQDKAVDKGSTSSLNHHTDLEHCFCGNHEVKIDVEYCVRIFFTWSSTSGLEIEAAFLYQSDWDPPGKMECVILTDVISHSNIWCLWY